ncbi:TlpA family protein disulfide reductase [Mucisphaera calidilacus]|uniref:Thioredoxin n=1 Tax=Mucisphaera calidilacus TaxID=2527982 RepID=A0A518BZP6_9BACT|nr:TlpA disulfide reductase family protein [Mucisphaera calidilacus]QDU72446.1 Thioredoxin [Mucisphaera calidilacus]
MTLRTAIAACLLAALTACDQNSTAENPPPTPAVNTTTEAAPAPKPDLPDALPVLDIDGIEALIAESAARDQIVVIDFWATWCVPCVAMFPELHEGLVAMGDDVRAVSITLDAPGKYEQRAIAFLNEHHALKDAYLLVPDTDQQERVVERLGEQWSNLEVPAVFVFGPDGKLAGEFLGPDVKGILETTASLRSQ